MATLISVPSGRSGYAEVLRRVRDRGVRRAPRGLPTRDLGFTVIELESPCDALPVGTGRGVSTGVAAIEAAQLVAGRALPDEVLRVAPQFREYTEDGRRFHGAYGDRVGLQLLSVATKLALDRDTRQAVITLWNPALDNQPGMRDYPCTVALGFAVEADRLVMRTVMRSNDAWLGLPYDLFQFTQLQLTLARALHVEPGTYTHTAWSLHLYERDLAVSERVTPPRWDPVPDQLSPVGFGHPLAAQHGPATAVTLAMGRALTCATRWDEAGRELWEEGSPTASERWYRDALAEHLAPHVG